MELGNGQVTQKKKKVKLKSLTLPSFLLLLFSVRSISVGSGNVGFIGLVGQC